MENGKKEIKLRETIFKAGRTQRYVSQKAGIPESQLSMAIHGKFNLNHVQRAKIAEVLKVNPHEIFPEDRC